MAFDLDLTEEEDPLKRYGELYDTEPENRQLFFIHQVAQYIHQNRAEVALGSGLVGLGGLHRDIPGNIWSIFTQFTGFIGRMEKAPEELIGGSFPVPYPMPLDEDKVIEITPDMKPSQYRVGVFNMQIGAIKFPPLEEHQIDQHLNQIERCARALGIRPGLDYHIYDAFSSQVRSKTDFSGLPEIVTAVTGLRLFLDQNIFSHPHLMRTLTTANIPHPAYLFDGVIIVDSQGLITQERSRARKRKKDTEEWLAKLARRSDTPTAPTQSLFGRLVEDLFFKPGQERRGKRRRD